jgi:hypothetical protein
MSYTNLNNSPNYQLQEFAQNGFRVMDSSSSPVADEYYRVIYALEDSVVSFSAFHGDSITGKTLYAGQILLGLFDSVTVTSGSVASYIA